MNLDIKASAKSYGLVARTHSLTLTDSHVLLLAERYVNRSPLIGGVVVIVGLWMLCNIVLLHFWFSILNFYLSINLLLRCVLCSRHNAYSTR